jgi:hypothetical protein
MPRTLTLVLAVALGMAPSAVRANGDPVGGPPTVFERFVLSACTPCVRETHPIASLTIGPMTLPGFPRAAAGTAARSGEIAIEVQHAYQPGRPDWRSLALRVTLLVPSGAGGDLFRLGSGLLDGVDVQPLAQAVGDMARLAAGAPADSRADSVDVDFHGGTLRIGVVRIRGDAVGYVQTGDLPILLQRAVWEVPTTLYMPVKDLPAVAAALGQAAARIEQIRAGVRP